MLFDRYVIVDWSASAKPNTGADSIWIGAASHASVTDWETANPSTRSDAFATLRERLAVDIIAKRRVLVGFDFPFGYPASFAEKICPTATTPWLGVWKTLQRSIKDDSKNSNNRFQAAAEFNRLIGLQTGPFWGHPTGTEIPNLSWRGERGDGIRQYRHSETRVAGVQEVWKLYGQGSVGSQALLGIPRVASLWNHFGEHAEVWPFEKGFGVSTASPTIVFAEVWPGVIPFETRNAVVRDQIQVETLAAYFKRLDEEGNLAKLFERPGGLSADAAKDCISAEGWILGV